MKKCLVLCSAFIVVVMNPLVFSAGCITGFGCGEDVPMSNYTRQDVANELRAVPSTQSITLEDGSTMDVMFIINEQSLSSSIQQAALHRRFRLELVQHAHACSVAIGETLSFQATLRIGVTSLDGQRELIVPNERVTGYYSVDDTELRRGALEFSGRTSDGQSLDYLVLYVTQSGRGNEAVITRANVEGDGDSWRYSGT